MSSPAPAPSLSSASGLPSSVTPKARSDQEERRAVFSRQLREDGTKQPVEASLALVRALVDGATLRFVRSGGYEDSETMDASRESREGLPGSEVGVMGDGLEEVDGEEWRTEWDLRDLWFVVLVIVGKVDVSACEGEGKSREGLTTMEEVVLALVEIGQLGVVGRGVIGAGPGGEAAVAAKEAGGGRGPVKHGAPRSEGMDADEEPKEAVFAGQKMWTDLPLLSQENSKAWNTWTGDERKRLVAFCARLFAVGIGGNELLWLLIRGMDGLQDVGDVQNLIGRLYEVEVVLRYAARKLAAFLRDGHEMVTEEKWQAGNGELKSIMESHPEEEIMTVARRARFYLQMAEKNMLGRGPGVKEALRMIAERKAQFSA
ncbi:hypothetical protein KVT40_008187 [Elsinoe batatas]|uniref:Uncharacterized protein n=1 Tax=Elsinoe batatas TaxID=2601811 RepID=A0A8K0KWE2_9PEZI|nr:hypothetical protein KVT40_008187 [Elsinoe batatas]